MESEAPRQPDQSDPTDQSDRSEDTTICVEEPEGAGRGAWEPLPTAGLGLAVGMANVFAATLVAAGFAAAAFISNPRQDWSTLAESLPTNGLLIAVSAIAGAAASVPLIPLFISLRKGPSVTDYLGLRRVPLRTILAALAISFVFLALQERVTILLNRPVIPEWQFEVYRTSVFPPLLWVALIAAAPAFEETLFRGFLLEGFRHSRMGGAGAVLLTSFLWASLHTQYGPYEIAQIFLFGLLLGAMRLKMRSLWPCYAVHAFASLLAVTETALHLHALGG